MDSETKGRKEAAVANLHGTSPWEVLACFTPGFAMLYCVFCAIHHRVRPTYLFWLEVFFYSLYLTLWLTVAVDYLCVCAFVAVCIVFKFVGSIFIVRDWFPVTEERKWKHCLPNFQRLPSLSVFRAVIMLWTCLCILAVDFKVFSRRLAKTETFGYSLMDVGVGMFVFSNALVSPLAKGRRLSLRHSLKSIVPLLLLGLIRLIVLKALGYQEHPSEYGTHWNFFLTLAAVSVFLPFLDFASPMLLGACLCVCHQILLSSHLFTETGSLTDWVLQNGGRNWEDGIFVCNREAFMSLPGYLALALFGAAYGRILMKPCTLLKEYRDRFVTLILHSSFWLLVLSGTAFFGFPVSRRICNSSYVVWIMSFSLFLLACLHLFDLNMLWKTVQSDQDVLTERCPPLMSAVTRNGLVVFLAANLLTGLVNLLVPTLDMSPLSSVFILSLYMVSLLSVARLLDSLVLREKKQKCTS